MPSGAPTLSCHILLGASPFDNLAGHVNSAISVLGGDGPVEFFFIPFLFQRILLGEKHFLKTLNILVYIETKNKFPKWEAGKQREKKKKMTAVIACATPVQEKEPRFRRELVK